MRLAPLFLAACTAAAPPSSDLDAARRFVDAPARPVVVLLDLAVPSSPDQAHRERVARLQQRVLDDVGLEPTRRFGLVPGFATLLPPERLDALRQHPAVASVRPDRWSRVALDQSVPQVQGDLAHAAGFAGAGQAIAVLDTGVDAGHAFFGGRVVAEACFSNDHRLRFLPQSVCPNGQDTQLGPGAATPCAGVPTCEHGTHVAGIAASSDPVHTGVAPAADVIAVQVFSYLPPYDAYIMQDSDFVAALEHVYSLAGTYDIAAVNVSVTDSVSYPGSCDGVQPAVTTAIDLLHGAGIPTVVAAGNDGFTAGIAYPGCITNAVSVGRVDGSDVVANSSNAGPNLDLLAPGTGITSSVPGGGTDARNGTSQSAPHVAGAMAVLRSKDATLTPAALLGALTSTGLPVTDPRNGASYPRLLVDDALATIP
jgi:subtilisin family serine protease